MRWLKLFADVGHHPAMLELDDHQFRIWIVLLAMACDSDEPGTISAYRPTGLARALHTDPDRLAQALEVMVDLGLIVQTDGTIRISSWLQRQKCKPSDSPEATAERKRQSRQKNSGSADVTPLSRDSHADVTPPVTLVTGKEERRREEKRREENTPLAGGLGGGGEVLRTGGDAGREAAAERLMGLYPTSVQKRRGVAALVTLLETHDEAYLAARIADYTAFCKAKKRKFLDAHRWCETGAYADDLAAEIRQAQIEAVPTLTQRDLERQSERDPRIWHRHDAFTYRDTPLYREPSQAPIPDGWQLVRPATLGRRDPPPPDWPRASPP